MLSQSAWPKYGGVDCRGVMAKTEEQLLRVLRKKAGAGFDCFGLLERACLDGDDRADRVTIASGSAQAKRDRISKLFHSIVQDAQLWGVAILDDYFQASVPVEIG